MNQGMHPAIENLMHRPDLSDREFREQMEAAIAESKHCPACGTLGKLVCRDPHFPMIEEWACPVCDFEKD